MRSVVDPLNSVLDRTVIGAHRLLPGRYHPYFLAEDVGAALFVAGGFALTALCGVLDPWTHLVAISSTYRLYSLVYLRVKRRVTGTLARSAVQDSAVFIVPFYLALSAFLGQPLAAALDMVGFSILLAIAAMRVGCFLGGCCYGRECRLGVVYTDRTQRSVAGWRVFTAGSRTPARVFPLQLPESLVVLGVVVWLGWLEVTHGVRGEALLLAVLAYGSWRVVSDFLRGHRHRPIYGLLSESQLVCILLMATCTVLLVVVRCPWRTRSGPCPTGEGTVGDGLLLAQPAARVEPAHAVGSAGSLDQ